MVDDAKKGTEKNSKIISALQKKVKALEEKMADDTIKASYDISGRMEKAASTYRKIQREFIREGQGFFDKFTTQGEYNTAFESVAKFGEKFFADSEKALRPMKDMATTMGNFITYGKSTQEELGRMAAVFSKLGLEAKTFGGILDTASRAFGKNEEEIKKLGLTMMNLSKDLLLNPEKLAQNFRSAQKSLAYDSETLLYVFKKLQFTSKATGVSFDTLTSAFGNTMDSFQGSANIAGKLNAILGKSVFNSMDLLGKTESQRIETIVSGLTNSLGSRIGKLGKFEMKAIADTLGLSPEDTRRLLRGGGDIKKVLEQRTADPEKKKAKALNDTTSALNKFKKVIRDSRSAFEQFNVEMSAGMIDKFERDIHPDFGAQAFTLGRAGKKAFKRMPPNLMRELRDRSVFMTTGEITQMKGALEKGDWKAVATLMRKRPTGGKSTVAANLLSGLEGTTGNTAYLKFEAIRQILDSNMGPFKKAHLLRTISDKKPTSIEELQKILKSSDAAVNEFKFDEATGAATTKRMWARAIGMGWLGKKKNALLKKLKEGKLGDFEALQKDLITADAKAGERRMKALAAHEIAASAGGALEADEKGNLVRTTGPLAQKFKPTGQRIAMGRGDNITHSDAARIAAAFTGRGFKITKQGAKIIVELGLGG